MKTIKTTVSELRRLIREEITPNENKNGILIFTKSKDTPEAETFFNTNEILRKLKDDHLTISRNLRGLLDKYGKVTGSFGSDYTLRWYVTNDPKMLNLISKLKKRYMSTADNSIPKYLLNILFKRTSNFAPKAYDIYIYYIDPNDQSKLKKIIASI